MLELRNIVKKFGSVVVNDNVSMSVERGTIHAIVGENGAGKSTIMKIAYGFYGSDGGEILLNGKEVNIKNPHDAIALGIGMVHQHFMLVETMTVAENIILGAETGGPLNLDLEKANADILKLSNDLRLGVNPRAVIEDLSVGQQQRVELLKALYRNADILILDEPTAVLTPQEVEELFVILRRMKEQGKTIIIITHKLEEVLSLSDNVTVMRGGKVTGNVLTSETNARDLAKMIVGREVLLRVEKEEAKPKDVILEVKDICANSKHGTALENVSFNIRGGEIVGIAGIEGNGQTELIEVLAGLMKPTDGTISYKNENITNISVKSRREKGIAHIPEDRHKRGLLLNSDLTENAILGVHYREPVTSNGGFISGNVVQKRVEDIIERFDVRPPRPDYIARSLSGGNQQKLIVGREFEIDPDLLLVSQPTRGVDIGAIEFIHRKLLGLRDKGGAILLVSAELEEVTALADRLLIFRNGKIVAEVDPATTSHDEIGLLMTGGDRSDEIKA